MSLFLHSIISVFWDPNFFPPLSSRDDFFLLTRLKYKSGWKSIFMNLTFKVKYTIFRWVEVVESDVQ
jgi:hypothetical protein